MELPEAPSGVKDRGVSQSKQKRSRSLSSNPAVHNTPDSGSASEYEGTDRRIREKLKKTSIANISKDDLSLRSGAEPEQPRTATPPSHQEFPELQKNAERVEELVRGRPSRKRSFDDLAAVDEGALELNSNNDSISLGHVRKRSRDATALRESQEDLRMRENTKSPNLRDDKHQVGDRNTAKAQGSPMRDAGMASSETALGQDKETSVLSPRKKRSRDEIDLDTDREQKIAATEETRANRTSEEIERGENVEDEVVIVDNTGGSAANGQPDSSSDHASTPGPEDVASMEPPTPNLEVNASEPKPVVSPVGKEVTSNKQEAKSSATKFAASGFAALSGSSTSPFGALSDITTSKPSSFGSVPSKDPPQNPPSIATDKSPALNLSNGYPNAAASTVSAFGGVGASAFGNLNASQQSPFGGSVFGSGFGTSFGGGPKLSTFAAPTGDAKLSNKNMDVKPFGAVTSDGEEEEKSDSDGDGLGDHAKDDTGIEVDDRFREQNAKVDTGEDGEETIFASRAALFAYKGSQWREAGKGTFKVNVAMRDLDATASEGKAARFIMRAHQTYRVLLNAPIFKQMKVGDSKGQEPMGKSVAFAVVEEGKPTPYMIRMGDETQAKSLYREVRTLQEELES